MKRIWCVVAELCPKKGTGMRINLDAINQIFSEELGPLMETYQAAFGESEKWQFIRQVLLKRFNKVRNRTIDELKRQGATTEGNGSYETRFDKQ
jgi:hypothetical protein